MKKIIVSLLVLVSAASANAQEAFKHLGAGLEAGTTGAGVQLALPVVTNHITFKLGYNFPNITYTQDYSMDISYLNQSINELNAQLDEVGAPEHINTSFNDKLDMEFPLSLRLGSFKAMFEYYPWAKSSFHFTVGAYFGGADFVTADAYTDAAFWQSYKDLKNEFNAINKKYEGTPGYEPANIPDIKANVNGETWAVNEKDSRGHLDVALAIAKARPYFGLGFGRSVPQHRVTFKFDLGAWYHGTPELTSHSKTTYDASASSLDFDDSLLDMLSFWPQLSFGLNVRLF